MDDKVYSTFKELFGNIKVDSIKEALPKINVYNKIIARHVEEINLQYCIKLNYTHLEASEIGHWAEMFQVAMNSNDKPEPQQPQQPPKLQQPQEPQQSQDPQQVEQPQQAQQPPASKVIAMSPQVQALLCGDQQAEIDRLTNVTAQWSTEEPYRAENTNYYTSRHWTAYHKSAQNMSSFRGRDK